jgi:hypothetical protein
MRIDVIGDRNSSALARRVEELAHYYLGGQNHPSARLRLSVDEYEDPLGMHLYRCRAEVEIAPGGRMQAFEEVQADLAVAVKRAVERSSRSASRWRWRRHIAASG